MGSFPQKFPAQLGAGGGGTDPLSGGYSAEAYARQLRSLLPRGLAWLAEAGSVIEKILLGIADELARVDGRGLVLQREMDPRTALETLEDWERVFGLPDESAVGASTLSERRAAVVQRLTSRGGQSRAFFIAIAAALGFSPATIDELHGDVLRVGFRVGARCYGEAFAHAWRMNLPDSVPVHRRTQLESAIRRAAPAHSVVLFSYS